MEMSLLDFHCLIGLICCLKIQVELYVKSPIPKFGWIVGFIFSPETCLTGRQE
jgi:hypothetical protein